ncbi:hypothetical protein QYF61_007210 [Mycteria americana]|uniref:Uncharacterized protein n=1 Tax=Mycteria americana TaxID=33587 RepID=A0AAN7S638_MYCAM|nr:hypothetical protein QYF61_007210 [Mycteria americana]
MGEEHRKVKDKKKNKDEKIKTKFSKRIEEIKAGRKRGRGGGKGEKGTGEGTRGRRTGRLGEVVGHDRGLLGRDGIHLTKWGKSIIANRLANMARRASNNKGGRPLFLPDTAPRSLIKCQVLQHLCLGEGRENALAGTEFQEHTATIVAIVPLACERIPLDFNPVLIKCNFEGYIKGNITYPLSMPTGMALVLPSALQYRQGSARNQQVMEPVPVQPFLQAFASATVSQARLDLLVKPVPMLDNPFSEEKFPNIQSKPPLAQLEAISSHPITCYLGEETDPHLSTTSFQVVVESNKVSPESPSLQAKQSQLPQPLLIRLLLQTLHQLHCPSLDTLQHLNVFLVVKGPKQNTVFEVRPHHCRVQGHNHFPSPAGHTIPDTSQDAIGFLGHLGTLLAHSQAAVNQHPQVLLCQAAFQPLFPKPVPLCRVVVAQVQDVALGLVEPHTIGPSPLIQPVWVPLQSLPTLKQINTPTQLGVICKLTEGALDPFVQTTDKDVKQNWPQHRALGDTTCDRPPTGVNSIHHHSLGPAIQPVLYPAKSTPVQAMISQFLQENAMGNSVKGFTRTRASDREASPSCL